MALFLDCNVKKNSLPIETNLGKKKRQDIFENFKSQTFKDKISE